MDVAYSDKYQRWLLTEPYINLNLTDVSNSTYMNIAPHIHIQFDSCIFANGHWTHAYTILCIIVMNMNEQEIENIFILNLTLLWFMNINYWRKH